MSCIQEGNLIKEKKYNTTLLIYISAQNNLYNNAVDFYRELDRQHINNSFVNVVVLFDCKDGCNLYQLRFNNLHLIHSFGEVNTSSGQFIKKLFTYIKDNYKSKEYGAIFWSHGSGWLPTSNLEFRSFGYDRGLECDIIDMSDAIPFKLDYIIFDACYMGSIEVYFEFKEKAKYIIGSPIIVPNDGIVRGVDISMLVDTNYTLNDRLKNICDRFYLRNKIKYSSSISMISTLDLSLFSYVNLSEAIIDTKRFEYPSIRGKKVFYDFSIIENFVDISTSEIYERFIEKVFLYKKTNIGGFGVSIYIPNESNKSFINYYRRLKWNKSVHWLDYIGSRNYIENRDINT